tara:strand:- start:119 stop:1030 length:912 start_codon:yes stop_codon:yes gene_type:complete
MHLKKIKKLVSMSLIFIPFLYGNLSCSNKNLNVIPLEENSELIPTISGVAALGQLVPMGEVRKLASPISQFGNFPRVQEILVKEGDYVKQGSILAIFENQKKLEANLLKTQKLLETNQREISLKKDQIKRYKAATEKNAYSIVLLAQKEDELLKLEKQKIINSADKKSIEIDLFNTKLRSPIDGYILSINTRAGERSDSEGILEIGASQKMQALIEVYESDIDRVFLDQNVELISENGGFEGTLIGKVIRINPQVKQRKVLSTDPTGDADARIIKVLVNLDDKSILRVKNFAGMKVIAKFIPK